MKQKVFSYLTWVMIIFILCSCINGKSDLSTRSIEDLSNGGILYLKNDNRIILDTLQGEQLEISESFPSRISYSNSSQTLLVNSLEVVNKIFTLNHDGREYFGANFDSCDIASFIENGETIVFVTYESFIQDQQTYEGPMVLAKFNKKFGLNKIEGLNLDFNNNQLIDTCVLGTNIEYNNNIYYKDIYDGKNVVYQLNLATNDTKSIFSFDGVIIAPAISPDGKYLAFTSLNGIFVYDVTLDTITQIYRSEWYEEVNQAGYDLDTYFHPSQYIPVVSWGPDSTKLVFQEFEFIGGYESDQIKIIDVTSKNVVIISDEGYYPYWIIN